MSDTCIQKGQTEELVIQIEDEPGDAKGKNNDEKEKKENPTCDAELSDKLRREHIINMLTEKQPEAVIGGEKRYIVAYFEKAPPTGEQFHYENGNRNDFVRLVFLIVFCMLVVTAAFTFATYNLKAVQKAFRTLPFLIAFIVCCVMTIVLEYIFCLSSCSRSVPCNYILLVIANICFTYMSSFITGRYAPEIVLGAVFVTLIIVAICLGLACTKFDFTRFILIVCVAGIAVMFAGFGCVVISVVLGIKLTILKIVLTIISSVISSVALIIELQMILGGKNVELGLGDYAYGAFRVYTSIMQMFFRMLYIIHSLVNLEDLL